MQDILWLFVLCSGWQLIAQELLGLDYGGHVQDWPWSYRDMKLRNRRYDLSPRTQIYLISYPLPTLVWPPCQSPRGVERTRRLPLGAYLDATVQRIFILMSLTDLFGQLPRQTNHLVN